MNTIELKYPRVSNYIGGKFIGADDGAEMLEVYSPVDGSLLSEVPMSGGQTLDLAVAAAKKAFLKWSAKPLKERVQVFFKYRALLEKNIDELSRLISEENGKIYSESRAEIEKSIELCEFACSMPQIAGGEILEVSRGIDCREERYPLGVVASIVPFNFPSMVPHWTIPNAIVLGNAMIMKPSEKVPLSMLRIAEMLREAGLPDGVFNIVNGDRRMVEAICDHPGIEAISFVGSTRVAKAVYRRGTSALKRVLALGGAKNHLIVLPDADPSMTASNIIASVTGCCGQRCMAASVMLAVGEVDHIIDKIAAAANALVPGDTLGAVISRESKERIEKYITDAEKEGAKILVDGRNTIVEGLEGGYYVGATIIDHVSPDMAVAREEIFGPVLSIVRVGNVPEAIELENRSPYGNAAGIFTQSGSAAKLVAEKVSVGMVGINIGVPVPREPFSFGGWNDSKFGALDITGKSSIEFWTKMKKITTKWNPESGINWMS